MINYISLLVFYIFIFFVGRGSLTILSKLNLVAQNDFDENKKYHNITLHTFYPIVGLFIIGNLSIFFNFFIPISNNFTFSMLFILLIGNFLKKLTIQIKRQEIFLVFITLPILSISSYLTGLSYDAGLYHLNYQKWLQDEKIILGLSNFHSRFGYSSIYDFINTNFWYSENFLFQHFVNLIFVAFFFTAIHNIYENSKNINIKIGIMCLLLYGILDNFGFSGGKNGFIEIEGITKYDTPFGIIFLLTLMFVAFYYIEKKQSDFEISIILIFALFAFQMRISGALLIIPLLPIFFVRGLGNAIKNNLFLVFFGVSNILKNLLTTGCLYFPIEITCFESLKWYQQGYAELEKKSISFTLRSYSSKTDLNDWFEIWINKYEYNLPTLKNFLVAFIFLNIFNYFVLVNRKFSYIYLSFFVFNIFLVIYWIFTAPSFRYGIGFFLSFIFFGSVYIGNSIKYKYLLNKYLFMSLLFLTILFLPRIDNYFELLKNPTRIITIEPLIVEYVEKENGFGFSPSTHNEICMINKYCSPKYSNLANFEENIYGYKYFELIINNGS